MKHTPGPWTTPGPHPTATTFRIDTSRGSFIVSCSGLPKREEWEANSGLIAAAPELLEALKTSESLLKRLRVCNRDFIQEINEACERAHAAIAKTKGEGK